MLALYLVVGFAGGTAEWIGDEDADGSVSAADIGGYEFVGCIFPLLVRNCKYEKPLVGGKRDWTYKIVRVNRFIIYIYVYNTYIHIYIYILY